MQKGRFLPGSWRFRWEPLIVASFVLLTDQLTKVWIRRSLLVGESFPQQGVVRFTHVQNDGIIFGIDAPQAVTLIFPILLVLVALVFSAKYSQADGWPLHVAIGLFIGGSLGNFVDRLVLGHVTDFVDIRLWSDFHWPAFNVADASIVVGVILLSAFMIRSVWKTEPSST